MCWAICRLVLAVFQSLSPVSFINFGRVLKFQQRLDSTQPDPVSIGSLIWPDSNADPIGSKPILLSGQPYPSNPTPRLRQVLVRFGLDSFPAPRWLIHFLFGQFNRFSAGIYRVLPNSMVFRWVQCIFWPYQRMWRTCTLCMETIFFSILRSWVVMGVVE